MLCNIITRVEECVVLVPLVALGCRVADKSE
jgi:hypothetical protein